MSHFEMPEFSVPPAEVKAKTPTQAFTVPDSAEVKQQSATFANKSQPASAAAPKSKPVKKPIQFRAGLVVPVALVVVVGLLAGAWVLGEKRPAKPKVEAAQEQPDIASPTKESTPADAPAPVPAPAPLPAQPASEPAKVEAPAPVADATKNTQQPEAKPALAKPRVESPARPAAQPRPAGKSSLDDELAQLLKESKRK